MLNIHNIIFVMIKDNIFYTFSFQTAKKCSKHLLNSGNSPTFALA